MTVQEFETFDELAAKYCERQESTPEELRKRLSELVERFAPDGFMLLEAADMSSSWLGQLTILPYGGGATYKEVPSRPVSPRGLASDMSVVVGTLSISNFSKRDQ